MISVVHIYKIMYCLKNQGSLICKPCSFVNIFSTIFKKIDLETGWSECSKTCGGGEKFKMVNNAKQVSPCNTLPCPGLCSFNFVHDYLFHNL